MKIVMNTGGIAATNSFLVADEQEKVAVIFDAPELPFEFPLNGPVGEPTQMIATIDPG